MGNIDGLKSDTGQIHRLEAGASGGGGGKEMQTNSLDARRSAFIRSVVYRSVSVDIDRPRESAMKW